MVDGRTGRMKIVIEMELKEEQVKVFKVVRAMTFQLEELGQLESFQMIIKEDEDADSGAVQKSNR